MRTQLLCILGLVAVTGAFVVGCGDATSTGSVDGGFLTIGCIANTRECINDRVARLCPADGNGWIVIQCNENQTCDAGACVNSNKQEPCTVADNTCMDTTTALRCSSVGSGFDSVTCPSGTACVGPGLCEGSCVVGSSICTDAHNIATCADGKTYTIASCGTGEACVRVGDSPVVTSACKPSDCTPDPNGCDAVCGNKADPMAAGQESTVSVCTETPNGYKWVPTTCAAPKTCSPSAGSCLGGTQAACSTECTPGEQRCTTLAGAQVDFGVGPGYQTCSANGTWSATVTACNASATSFTSLCFAKTGDPAHVVCGDPACALAPGACDAGGLFHACGSDGKVAATGTACNGVCVALDISFPFALKPGSCQPECEPGDELCGDPYYPDSQTYRVCGANNKWGAPTSCSGSDFCQQYSNAAGRPRKICGDCLPGQTQCTGADGGVGSDSIATCDATGHYGADVTCTVGHCQYSSGPSSTASCVADCVPGTPVCIGNVKGVTGAVYYGTDEVGTCTADGKIPAGGSGTLCNGEEVCRRHGAAGSTSGGASIGCTICVGSNNEFGLTDTRCSDVDGNPYGDYLQSCKADGSAWDTAVVACVNPSPYCNEPSTGISVPAVQGSYCHGGPYGLPETTQSALQYFESDCSSYSSAPVSCPSLLTGTVNDCCSDFCKPDPSPYPAYCGEGGA